MFLHGLGASGRYWQPLADTTSGLAGTAPDMLGFGRSPATPDASYDVDCHLEALAPYMPEQAVVVGHSTGALLAVALAARMTQRVRSLVLLGMPAYPDEETARAEIGRLGLLARLTAEGSPLARLLCEAMCMLRPLAIAIAPLVIRDLPPSIASDGARHTWASYHRTLERVVIGYRPAADLSRLSVPVTFLHGRQDRTAPLHHVEDLLATVTGSTVELRVVDGDHHLAVRRPEVVADTILQHVARPE